MKQLLVTPDMGIGKLKLGMTPEQVLEAIQGIVSEFEIAGSSEIQISKDSFEEEGCTTLRYQKDAMFFMVRYRENRAAEISVNRDFTEYAPVLLYDIDMFNTKAEELVNELKTQSVCVCDWEDEDLGTDYEFADIGIRLWRERPFHEKLLNDESYMEEMALVIEEEYRYLYFDIVTVKER